MRCMPIDGEGGTYTLTRMYSSNMPHTRNGKPQSDEDLWNWGG